MIYMILMMNEDKYKILFLIIIFKEIQLVTGN